jgi:uncharacterized membrane protein (DUF4010 family)
MFKAVQDTVQFLPDHLVTTDSFLEADDLLSLLQKLAIAILIGALVGLEREHSKPKDEKVFAGIRTFPLISILGFISALIASATTLWIYVASLIGFSALIIVSHSFSAKGGRPGGTSEISTVLVFFLGSLVYWNLMILAAVIGVLVTLFLSLKIQMHAFVGKVSEEDLYATIKLAILTVIVLPLLPDQTYGPFDVLNPRLIWYMVIFISGISFVGYILIKTIGQNKGIPLTGLMGGLVSSTAVAFSLSRKTQKNKELSGSAAVGIILASSIMYPRILIVTLVVNSALAASLWLPMLIFTAAGFIIAFILSKKLKNGSDHKIEMKNPFELKSALLFGLIFGIVIFLTKAAEVHLGSGGIFAASALAGITSVDAIVISLANIVTGSLTEDVAVSAIIIATISNSIVKGVIASVLGTPWLKKNTWIGMTFIIAVSLIYLGIIWMV